jgi:ATP-grasp domain, R2K clade family 3
MKIRSGAVSPGPFTDHAVLRGVRVGWMKGSVGVRGPSFIFRAFPKISCQTPTRSPGASVQWILQDFEDTAKLAAALDRLGLPDTWHKVVPFVGDLVPWPEIPDPRSVVMFGAYSLWCHAKAHGLWPGVFRLKPFLRQAAWQDHLLNGPGAIIATVARLPDRLADDGTLWFPRPVDDSKDLAGTVKSTGEILDIAAKVLALPAEDLPSGSPQRATELMLCRPMAIQKEWQVWIAQNRIVTFSLYKEGGRGVCRTEIDDDARALGQRMVRLNPDYALAYVMDSVAPRTVCFFWKPTA